MEHGKSWQADREAGAATGIGGANGRAEDCLGVDGALGEDVMVETGASAA